MFTTLSFRYHSLRRDVSNFSLLRHRDYKGFLISMHQSGTHWLKHMLATAIARRHGLPDPRFSHANDIIGGVHDPFRHAAPVPHIASSHSIPHPLVASPLLRRRLRFPPYVILARDLRAALVSNFEKWKQHYNCGFSEFLRGDPRGRRFNSDIWWSLRFANAWGRILSRFPNETLLVRYEDLARDALGELARINAHWGLDLDEASLRSGIEASSKERMDAKRDPDTPLGLTVVRRDERPFTDWYDAADRRFVEQLCRRHLRHDLGYDYGDWSAASS